MKTAEELNALKEEVETLNKNLHNLTDEELTQVAGGERVCQKCGGTFSSHNVKNGIYMRCESCGYSFTVPHL